MLLLWSIMLLLVLLLLRKYVAFAAMHQLRLLLSRIYTFVKLFIYYIL